MKTSCLLGLLLLPALVVAYPTNVGCNLMTTTNKNIMTTTETVMGVVPQNDANIITFQSATMFTAGSAGASAHQPYLFPAYSPLDQQLSR